MSGFKMDDYVDVAERIGQFYEKYPKGSLTRKGDPEILSVGNKTFVKYTALAYREPHDPRPAMGTAWEPFPGPTPYTRDSELMNAETSAWGRAIIAAGIPSKKIASAEEVRNRQPAQNPTVVNGANAKDVPFDAPEPSLEEAVLTGTIETEPAPSGPPCSPAQARMMFAKAKANGITPMELEQILRDVAGVTSTDLVPKALVNDVVARIEPSAA